MRKLVARQIEISEKGNLVIDRVTLPWFLAPEFTLEDVSGNNSLYGLTITLYADRAIIHSAGGKRDTAIEAARAEAVSIVREGLKDVIEWSGYVGGQP